MKKYSVKTRHNNECASRLKRKPSVTCSMPSIDDISQRLSRLGLALYVFTQIITQCSKAATSMPSLPWQAIDMICQATCISFALLSIATKRSKIDSPQFALMSVGIFALACSGVLTNDTRLFVGFVVVISLADDNWKDLCMAHCRATMLAVALIMCASLTHLIQNSDFIPNGRLVFAYGFRHPNHLGALLFSMAASLTCAAWRSGRLTLPLIASAIFSLFSFLSLSSNASAALCSAVFVINLFGLAAPRCRDISPSPRVSKTLLLIVPAFLFALMLISTACFDGGQPPYALLNKITHWRPFFAHKYFSESGGFTLIGQPAIIRNEHHAGTGFWGVDSGYCQLALIYGLMSAAALAGSYILATRRKAGHELDFATVAIMLLCATYLVIEAFPLYAFSSIAPLFLAGAFSQKRNDTRISAHKNKQ